MVDTAYNRALAATGAAPTIARSGDPHDATVARFVAGLERVMRDAGYHAVSTPAADTRVVLHPVDLARTKPYRRKAAPTFVIAIASVAAPVNDGEALLKVGYPVL